MHAFNTERQLAPQSATIRHPIQELRFCAASANLYATSAGQLWALSPTTGEVLRRWKAPAVKVEKNEEGGEKQNEGWKKKNKKGKGKEKPVEKVEGNAGTIDGGVNPVKPPQMKKEESSLDSKLAEMSDVDKEATLGPAPKKPVPLDEEQARMVGEDTSLERASQRRRLLKPEPPIIAAAAAEAAAAAAAAAAAVAAKNTDIKMEDKTPTEEKLSSQDVEMKDASPSTTGAVTQEKHNAKGELKIAPKRPDRHPRVIVNTIGYFIITSDGSYIVVATLEDKTLRVLDAYNFVVINEWTAIKRPCGLAFADEESTVIVGDKFGDVYAHALHPPRSRALTPEETSNEDVLESITKPDEIEPDTMSGNGEKVVQRSTTPPPYESKPLLGHVSMLTALTTITIPPELDESHAKSYIITADRDEHIRITNYPQSYDIEGYCLGHKSFVSRLHVPKWDQKMLISGGGDDNLFVWDWKTGKVRQKIDLRGPLEKFYKEEKEVQSPKAANKRKRESEERTAADDINPKEINIAVNGIWPGPLPRTLIVGLEKIPAMFLFKQRGVDLEFEISLSLRGPILSCAVDADMGWTWVSVDFPHALLQKFELIGKDPEDYEIYETTKVDKATQFVNSEMTFSGVRVGSIGEEGGHPDDVGKRLYTAETLRKQWSEDFAQ